MMIKNVAVIVLVCGVHVMHASHLMNKKTDHQEIKNLFAALVYKYQATDKEFLELDTQAQKAKTAQEKEDIDRKTFFRFRNTLGHDAKDVFNTVVLGYCNTPPGIEFPMDNIVFRRGRDILVWADNNRQLAYQNTNETVAVYHVGYGEIELQHEIPLLKRSNSQQLQNYNQLDYAWSPDNTQLAVLLGDGSGAVLVHIVDLQGDLQVTQGEPTDEFRETCSEYHGLFTWSSDGICVIDKHDSWGERACKVTWNEQGQRTRTDTKLLESLGVDRTVFRQVDSEGRKAFIERCISGKLCTYKDSQATVMVGAQTFGSSLCPPALSCDDTLLATVPFIGRLCVWNVNQKKQQAQEDFSQSGHIDKVIWHPTLPILAVRCSGGIYFFDAVKKSNKTVSLFRRERTNSPDQWSPDGTSFVHVMTGKGAILLWQQAQIAPYSVPSSAQEGAVVTAQTS
jgi:hypothetical protein